MSKIIEPRTGANQSTAAATRTPKTATVFNNTTGAISEVTYLSLVHLMRSLHKFVREFADKTGASPQDDDFQITLEDGTQFYWNTTIAHYCFGERRISEKQAYKMMRKGGAL